MLFVKSQRWNTNREEIIMQSKSNISKNSEFEMYRVLMILAIAILHFSEDYTGLPGILPGGYLGVDFFFLLSGYFLMQHFLRHYISKKSAFSNTMDYFCERIKKLYPPYLTAILGMSIITWGFNGFGLKTW